MPLPGGTTLPSSTLFPGGPYYPPQLTEAPAGASAPDLERDLPQFERGAYDIQAVLRVVGLELQRLEEARQQLIQNFFPATADSLLHFFEDIFGVTTDPVGLTLDERRQVVEAYFKGLKSSGSGLEWEDTITSVMGSNWNYAEHKAGFSDPANYTVNITIPFSPPASVPSGCTATPSTSSGSLAAGTYYYGVTATTAFGETRPCTAVSASLASTGKITVSWSADPAPATGYNVYRGATAGSLGLLASVTAASYVDNGSATPTSQAPPTQDTSGNLVAGLATTLIRQITPAHLAINYGYTSGFLVGISEIGIDTL
jgi:hypothetical protein